MAFSKTKGRVSSSPPTPLPTLLMLQPNGQTKSKKK